MSEDKQNQATPALAVAPCSAAWLRGADAAHKEEQFFEEPRNPYKPGTGRAKAWEEGYEHWLSPRSPNPKDEPRP